VSTESNGNWPRRHQFTADEYNWLAEVGMLDTEHQVELIEGEIITMGPVGTRHRAIADRLDQLLSRTVAGRAIVRVPGTFRLSTITEPQSDLVLLQPSLDDRSADFATGSDTLVVIEVSDTTFRYDRDVKIPLYARHGIPEVWIVDLERKRLHFFRSLEDGEYSDVSFTCEPGVIPIASLAGLSVDLSGLLSGDR
jgi:Uma2 family endonuclease